MMERARMLLIANPGNRRAAYHQAALRALGHPPAELLSWRSLIDAPTCSYEEAAARLSEVFHRAVEGSRGLVTHLRLESPGEDARVQRALWRWGVWGAERAGESPELGHGVLEGLEQTLGELLAPRQLRLGWQLVLEVMGAQVDALGQIAVSHHPSEVAIMFDKLATHEHLDRHGIARIESLVASCYDELIERMEARGWPRVFMKLRGSSSASGVAAFERRGGQVRLITTAHVVSEAPLRVFNSLRLRHYGQVEKVSGLINWLLGQGAVIERWLDKARVASEELARDVEFDVRWVCIEGEPCHQVARTSTQPMTNLHLGNQRGNLEVVSSALGARAERAAYELVVGLGRAFPRSRSFGADVVYPREAPSQPRVIEVNAFGDLLPNLLYRGEDTHTRAARLFLPVAAQRVEAPIEAILFDLDNTLIERDAAFALAVQRWTGCDDARLARLIKLDDHGHGDRRRLCDALADALGLDEGDEDARWQLVWQQLPERIAQELKPDPALLTWLHALKRRYKLAIVSNGGTIGQLAKIEAARLDEVFDPHTIFISERAQAKKPDDDIFRAALLACDVTHPERALMIGDTPIHDLVGAQSLGLRTAWMARGRTWHHALPQPDLILDHSPQLACTSHITQINAWLSPR